MAKYRIKLTQEEVNELTLIVKRGFHTTQTYRAAYVLLNCDEGAYSLGKSTNEQICAVLKIEFHVLNIQCLKRHIATMEEIKQEIDAWQEYRNGIKSNRALLKTHYFFSVSFCEVSHAFTVFNLISS